ncbi:MAG: hypothetical protein JSR46_01595, partial [Verrucomicrobia bacterium]|nr:hypothetical protein [Verrucomicrobiota bacterium]
TTLSQDIQKVIIAKISNGNGSILQKLIMVCTAWQNLIGHQDSDFQLWKPVFDMHDKQATYPIDLSNFTLYQAKLKISLATRKESFQNLLARSNVRFQVELDEKSDLTEHFKLLINKREFEILALYILCRPTFNSQAVAKFLTDTMHTYKEARLFCLKLLIKLQYNLRALFAGMHPAAAARLCVDLLHCGVQVAEILQCKADFSDADRYAAFPLRTTSLLREIFDSVAIHFYPQQQDQVTFVPRSIDYDPKFTDNKLDGYKTIEPISKDKVEQSIRELVFNCKLNLHLSFKPLMFFPPISMLEYWRGAADAAELPKDNVFKAVLDEYDSEDAAMSVEVR